MTSPWPGPRNRLKSVAAAAILTIVACGPADTGAPASGGTNADGSDTIAPEDPRTDASAALFAAIDSDGPGCSAAVNVNGGIAWSDAFGLASIDRDELLTPETIVDIGSASKQFTATAIGLLIDDGTIAWDDPVGDHLDGLPNWAAQVTVDDLVHHTSGIPDYIELLDDQGVDLLDPSTQQDGVDSLDGTELEFEPGTTFDYSNSNYLLMAELVGAVTGDNLPTYLNDLVFGPLRLEAEMTPGASSENPSQEGTAQSYEDNDGWELADSPWTQVGDGAVQTTPEQLALWGAQYWASDLPAGLDELRLDRAADMDDGGRYGLGIMEYPVPTGGNTVLTHSGGWSGFDTGFVLDPARRTAVAVTCNTPDGPVTSEVADELLEIWTG